MNNIDNKTPLQQIGNFYKPENIATHNIVRPWKAKPLSVFETYPELRDTFEIWYSFSGKPDDLAFPEIAMITRNIPSNIHVIEDKQIRYPEKHSYQMNKYIQKSFNKIKLIDATQFINNYGGDFFYIRTDILSPSITDATQIHRNKKLHLQGKYRLFVTDPRARDIQFVKIK